MMPAYLLNAATVIFLYMIALYVLSLILKNYGIVDIGWGLGFVLLTAVLLVRAQPADQPKWLVMSLITFWGFRLASHIFLRNFGKPEDFRYANMRKRWGKAAPLKAFFFIFMLQGVLMLIVSSPLLVVLRAPSRPLNALDILGALIFAAGLLFEVVGDLQLSAHVRNPANKGKLMTGGLWSLTRHPNYFGEATLWWGIGIIALSSASGWAGLIGPAAITFLLRFVSGVPLLEKKYAGRPDWEAYKTKTPIFFPRFRKKS